MQKRIQRALSLILAIWGGTAVVAAADNSYVVSLRRLTEQEYRNSIADIFGPDIKIAGRFEPAPIVAGDTRDGWTVVTQGLKAGDAYVRKGAFALKARLLRSQLGEE